LFLKRKKKERKENKGGKQRKRKARGSERTYDAYFISDGMVLWHICSRQEL
jgi:hypothetical protein